MKNIKCENCSKKIKNKNDGTLFIGNNEKYFVCQECLDNDYNQTMLEQVYEVEQEEKANYFNNLEQEEQNYE